LGGKTGVFGEFHGFVDGGVRGDAVEPEDLVEAQAQEVLEGGFGLGPGGFPGDQAVERGLPADDAANELVAEPAVGGGQARGGEGHFEQIFGEFTAGEALGEHSGCNLSWIFAVQHL